MKSFKNNLFTRMAGIAGLIFYGLSSTAQMTNVPQTAPQQPAAPQRFSYQPSTISEGQEMKVTYRPEDVHAKVSGVVYLFKNYKWEGHDLSMAKTDTGYVANYKVPEGTALLSYRFWVGDTVDAGGRFPYAVILHQKDPKKMMPGGLAEWGLFRTKQANYMLLPMVSSSAEIEPRTLVSLWIAKEYGNIEVRRNMFFDMARGIKSYVPPAKADSMILRDGRDLLQLNGLTEPEMIRVERTFRTVLRNTALADSVKALVLAKYPSGLRHRFVQLDSVFMVGDPAMLMTRLNAFVKQYPFDKYPTTDYTDLSLNDPLFYMKGYTGAMNFASQNKDAVTISNLLKTAPYELLNYYYLKVVEYPMRSTTPFITVKQQMDYSNGIIAEMLRRSVSSDPSLSGRGFYSPLEWKRLVIMQNKVQLSYHAALLYQAGDFTNSLKFANMVKPYIGDRNIDFNTLYVNLLDHNKKYEEAEQYIISAIKADAVSPAMLKLFKAYYVKKKGTESGYDEYFHALEPAEKLTQMYTKLEKSMVNIPAPMFNLKNLKGESIDLSAQKGKIVVLDFWASWCFPCKAAMPGMQTLVTHYKANQDVQFYFIATLEESEDYKQLAADFIKAKKYDFNVLFDEYDPSVKRIGMTYSDYAKLLHLNGIPQKVVIDGNGKIRWVSDGYNGDLVNLTREVEHIISVIQNEKS
ncbi:TlpA family protein disulfide reductase [Pedobacter sp. AW31-3R]|uniref:TlpA family protein disulfide reductase n=1 Tax=Pedobacter sp. AW31-3R TaxID=3445781 RepID=UPI003FA0B148